MGCGTVRTEFTKRSTNITRPRVDRAKRLPRSLLQRRSIICHPQVAHRTTIRIFTSSTLGLKCGSTVQPRVRNGKDLNAGSAAHCIEELELESGQEAPTIVQYLPN
ncbi:uncharacterized protein HMPREF1120_04309 [Exophiala dermatitidis NIH/UT8656]|uniref:Uncharacterized protein n=1 Tax=Exophiala dermatitidis (strain ATCC 34100 / CBS 525.76 / NIH/UT8656) TaxID=858893 RepID=H6BXB7_EXODN|nr:uncharacterized protein HMPREF1120_04309 [Exophiala dermatitidis NIH/UT8656]EHY56219.1 hypothetical protein HMPREF1120_04309 [Exophiala dermatitidis NIH/UT8656]